MSSSAGGLPPAKAYHRRPMRALNGVLRVLNGMGLVRVELDEQSLMRSARKQTGLEELATNIS